MTLKQILAELKKLGYTILDEDEGDFKLMKLAKDKHDDDEEIHRLTFETNELDHCCGVRELGDLSLDVHGKLNPEMNKLVNYLIQYAFLATKQDLCSSKARIPVGQQLIMTGNGQGAWKYAEPVLDEMWDDFQLVATTRNGSGGNVLKTYIGIY